jgi:hypothetical protein
MSIWRSETWSKTICSAGDPRPHMSDVVRKIHGPRRALLCVTSVSGTYPHFILAIFLNASRNLPSPNSELGGPQGFLPINCWRLAR